jgi:hypothetical protein
MEGGPYNLACDWEREFPLQSSGASADGGPRSRAPIWLGDPQGRTPGSSRHVTDPPASSASAPELGLGCPFEHPWHERSRGLAHALAAICRRVQNGKAWALHHFRQEVQPMAKQSSAKETYRNRNAPRAKTRKITGTLAEGIERPVGGGSHSGRKKHGGSSRARRGSKETSDSKDRATKGSPIEGQGTIARSPSGTTHASSSSPTSTRTASGTS